MRLPLCRSSSLACLEGRGSSSSAKGKQVRFRGSLRGRQRGAQQEARRTRVPRTPLIPQGLRGEGDPTKAAKRGSRVRAACSGAGAALPGFKSQPGCSPAG